MPYTHMLPISPASRSRAVRHAWAEVNVLKKIKTKGKVLWGRSLHQEPSSQGPFETSCGIREQGYFLDRPYTLENSYERKAPDPTLRFP